ncbi:xanthine dehydrogenase accessory protein XdhC [Marimonas arenosa]|uniref:Xanthine dehydrogenase accessory protein XdhC n=1 Tax=Marimonas arenosa TaxID=1795305 RepID=A0AAE3WFZ1_9RHOB|nr:xanthine dehydrogenase accessory protein XdhC [Marimonas arenosa]MDQ2091007.1 xanthine dehydrogenase accessory protein XdhC [Marimonas arenosa]
MTLTQFLEEYQTVVRVSLTRIRGSSPREAGAEMFVSPDGVYGTIGGGQLEYLALDQARAMIVQGRQHMAMDVPLGPEIGQCCGGRVDLSLDRLDAAARQTAVQRAQDAAAAWPEVLIFGAGHVGRALSVALAPLPLRVRLIDSRAEELARARAAEGCLTAFPEREIARAGTAAAFVVATHDHALDFLLAGEALQRRDASYVGMIGSATKRARFERWLRQTEAAAGADRLVCPMGQVGLGDKRPEVIAAFVATDLLQAFAAQNAWQGAEMAQ